MEILIEESNVQRVDAPVTVNIKFYILKIIFRYVGIFMDNFMI